MPAIVTVNQGQDCFAMIQLYIMLQEKGEPMDKEIIFLVEEAPEGGYVARALGYSIFTESDTLDAIREEIKDAIRCHFDEGNIPRMVRLHFIKEEIVAI
jgi:hypothetical protein